MGLVTNLDKFLHKIPNSSSSSDVSSQNNNNSIMSADISENSSCIPKFDDLKIDPMNMESIDDHMKIASEELFNKNSTEKALEVQMQLCPFSKIPKYLLPLVSSGDEDSSSDEETINNPDKKIQMLD